MSFHVPVRGGNRGGRDRFSWEEVKNDKHRENYLGHSVMAPVGRWQKGRDLTWYAKAGTTEAEAAEAARVEELRRIKAAEQDAMMVALGLKKPDRGNEDVHRTKEELAQIMSTMSRENEETGIEPPVDTVPGLGAGKSAHLAVQSLVTATTHDVLPGNVAPGTQPPRSSWISHVPVAVLSADHSPDTTKEHKKSKKEKRDKKKKHKRHRSRSRSPSSESDRESRRHRRHRSRSRSRDRPSRFRSRSRSPVDPYRARKERTLASSRAMEMGVTTICADAVGTAGAHRAGVGEPGRVPAGATRVGVVPTGFLS
ncbi:hypothetical protein GGF32_001258 [Allomyces javanicus]|nr:hypothetical protein GGF32_001258 [Allomyces javanicus]